MPLEVLSKFDAGTAGAVLAAAALSIASPGVDQADEFLSVRKDDVDAVLSEIRHKLNLGRDDNSSKAKASIDQFLSSALDESVSDTAVQAALARAGQAGRLTPSAYKVVQPETFTHQFYRLGITKPQTEEAIRHPDDYQHLMTGDAVPGEADVFSLFVKYSPGGRKIEPNWLLVQAFRRGAEQVAQSAWRVYSNDVDLSSARNPLDLLKAFVDAFGIEIVVGSQRPAKFVEAVSMIKSPRDEQMNFAVTAVLPPNVANVFYSWANRKTTNPSIFNVGLAYCIDMGRYRTSLISHGVSVT
jgi:hypothetical protein